MSVVSGVEREALALVFAFHDRNQNCPDGELMPQVREGLVRRGLLAPVAEVRLTPEGLAVLRGDAPTRDPISFD